MINKFLVFFFSFLLISFVSIGKENLQLVDKISLVVNGKPVLKSEIELAKKWFGLTDEKEAAKRLIEEILVAEAAEKAGINVSSEELERAIEKLAEANNFSSKEAFLKALESQGVILSQFRSIIKREILGAKFIQIYLRRNLFEGISEGKLENVKIIRIIYLKKDKPDFPDKFKAVYKGLEEKEPFEKLAKEYSDDPLTADKGGLLGEVKKGDLLPALDTEIWKHRVGDIFKVETEEGIYFIKIEKEDKSLAINQPQGKEAQEKLKKEFNLFLKKLKENAIVEYIDEDLK
ncbi:MAG: peptidylprolyl isomerase [Aquificae bacterium]|nr:peptidylprolyl isomerase [Aquificota bacterium]